MNQRTRRLRSIVTIVGNFDFPHAVRLNACLRLRCRRRFGVHVPSLNSRACGNPSAATHINVCSHKDTAESAATQPPVPAKAVKRASVAVAPVLAIVVEPEGRAACVAE